MSVEFFDNKISELRATISSLKANPPYPFGTLTVHKLTQPLEDNIITLEIERQKSIKASRTIEPFTAVSPGEAPKVQQTNDILKFAAIIAGLLVLSS